MYRPLLSCTSKSRKDATSVHTVGMVRLGQEVREQHARHSNDRQPQATTACEDMAAQRQCLGIQHMQMATTYSWAHTLSLHIEMMRWALHSEYL